MSLLLITKRGTGGLVDEKINYNLAENKFKKNQEDRKQKFIQKKKNNYFVYKMDSKKNFKKI